MRTAFGFGFGFGLQMGDSGYAAESIALFARMSSQPDATRKAAINTIITTLKSAGVWAKLEALQVYAAHDSQAALLNWISTSYNATNSSSTFTANQGYKGNGSTTHLSTGLNPSSAALSSLNDATVGFWVNTGYIAGASVQIDGAYDGNAVGVGFQPSSVIQTSVSTAINSAWGSAWNTASLNIPAHGPLSISRESSSTAKIYADGALVATNAALASTSRPNDAIRVGSLAGVLWNSRQTSAFWHGKALNATEHAALAAALKTYMQAVGNWSIPLVGWGDSLSNSSYYAGAAARSSANGKPWRRMFSKGVSAETSTQIAARVVADTTYTSSDFVHVIWMGRNDISNGAQTVDTTTITAKIAESVAAVNARSGKYIVLGLTPANLNAPGGSSFTNSEATGTTIGDAIAAHNAALSSLYGSRFLDIRQALIDYTNANLAGSDLTDAANGLPGRSLYASDGTGVHFGLTPTATGNVAVGRAIEDKIEALGW